MELETQAFLEETHQSTEKMKARSVLPPCFHTSPYTLPLISSLYEMGVSFLFYHYQVLAVDAYHMVPCTSNKKTKGKGGCIQNAGYTYKIIHWGVAG